MSFIALAFQLRARSSDQNSSRKARLWSVTCFKRIHFAPMMYRHITIMKTRISMTN